LPLAKTPKETPTLAETVGLMEKLDSVPVTASQIKNGLCETPYFHKQWLTLCRGGHLKAERWYCKNCMKHIWEWCKRSCWLVAMFDGHQSIGI